MVTRREFVAGAAAMGAEASVAAVSSRGRFELTVLNPECNAGGAGLCVVLRTPAGKTYLFDTGNGPSPAKIDRNNGRDIIMPWLKARGIGKIDGLILSHYHADHFGGLLWLWNHFEIGRIFDNAYEPLNGLGNGEIEAGKRVVHDWEKTHPGAVTRYLVAGDALGWDEPGVRFEVVWPPKTGYCTPLATGPDAKRNGSVHHLLNANSTALRVQVGRMVFLILGDANADYVKAYMRPYLERKGLWGGDVVVLHSHGIPDDHGENIAAMRPKPRVTVASLGNLRWMLGAGKASVAVYRRLGFDAYATNLHGNVTITCVDDLPVVTTDPTAVFPETSV